MDCHDYICHRLCNRQVGVVQNETWSTNKRRELAIIMEETKDTTRKKQTIKIVVTLLMPIVCIIAMSLASLAGAIKTYTSSNIALGTVQFGLKLGNLITAVQKERGMTTMFLSSDGNDVEAWKTMNLTMRDVDNAITELGTFPYTFSLTIQNHYFNNPHSLKVFFLDYRKQLSSAPVTLESNIYFYTNITQALIDSLTTYIIVPPGSDLWNRFVAFASIQLAGDALGIQRALGSSFYAKCYISQDRRNWFKILLMIQHSSVDQTYKYFPEMKDSYNTKIAKMWPLPGILEQKKEDIMSNNYYFCMNATSLERSSNGLEWFTSFTKYIEVIEEEATAVASQMVIGFEQNIANAQMELVLYSFAVVVTVIIVTVSAVCIYRMTGKVQIYARHITDKAKELQGEKQKTNHLLNQMLPKQVAFNLMNGKDVDAECHDGVSIYFSDIVGFTTISATCTPSQVVTLLNTLYSIFDATVERYDVYKVETIGDAYMVVAGLHTSANNIRHSYDIASMALDLRKDAMKCHVPYVEHGNVHLRAGIHSGPCAAGVVGKTMPRYCLFGDTVNTANRMESTGEALKIHISESTKQYLDEIGGFVTERRGSMSVKGKGNMETYWLVCRDSETAPTFADETLSNNDTFVTEKGTSSNQQDNNLTESENNLLKY